MCSYVQNTKENISFLTTVNTVACLANVSSFYRMLQTLCSLTNKTKNGFISTMQRILPMSLSCQLELFFSGPLSGSISISFKASSSLKRTREIQNKSHFTVSRTLLCNASCHARIVRIWSITGITGVFREESKGNLVFIQYFDHFIMFSN